MHMTVFIECSFILIVFKLRSLTCVDFKSKVDLYSYKNLFNDG